MKKRYILLIAVMFALSIGICAGVIHSSSVVYNKPKPMVVLFDDDNVGGNASYDSTEFASTKDSGNNIRVWYDNLNNLSVKVTLYKYGLFGNKDAVLEFEVDGESDNEKEYNSSQADSSKYVINITASDGGDINGYLRAIQIS